MAASKQSVTETELRSLIDAVTDYEIVLTDTRGDVLVWSKGAEKIKGYTGPEILGKNIGLFYPEEEREKGQHLRDMKQALDQGRYETDAWRIGKNGARMWVNMVLMPVRDATGKHVGYAKIVRDLTERMKQEKLIQRQREDLLELSTPVIQVWDKVLALPIIGTLDSQRAARLTENLLMRISQEEAEYVIIDISGVPTVDSQVAQHLLKTVQGARLMGAESILSGVRPETAQAMVHLGVDVGTLKSRSTLRDALQLALSLRKATKGDLAAAV